MGNAQALRDYTDYRVTKVMFSDNKRVTLRRYVTIQSTKVLSRKDSLLGTKKIWRFLNSNLKAVITAASSNL